MKVFVDTSVWIDYLGARRKTDKTKFLAELVESGQAIYSLPVIVQEILQGVRHERDIYSYAEKLEALNLLNYEYRDAVEAAKYYRILRKSGITATTIDLQIVSVCVRHSLRLLTEDRDFYTIAGKVKLTVV